MLQLLATDFQKPAVLFEGLLPKKKIEYVRVTRVYQVQYIRPPEIKESEKHRHCGMEQKARALLVGGKVRYDYHVHGFVVLRQAGKLCYACKFERAGLVFIKYGQERIRRGRPRVVRNARYNLHRAELEVRRFSP